MTVNEVKVTAGAPLLAFPENCREGKLLRRIKRFTVEIEYNGKIILAHCNDSGAMLGLLRAGAPVMFSHSSSLKRKLPWTLECIWVGAARKDNRGFWARVNTSVPNKMLEAAFNAGCLGFAAGYEQLRREARRGSSRLDACLYGPEVPNLWVECKSVTLVEEDTAYFPDAQSERARRHICELMEIVNKGERAAMFYLIQRPDAKCFAPADFIDPEYARLFYKAMKCGVEMYPYLAHMEERGASLGELLDIKADS